MSASFPDWRRRHYTGPAGDPYLFYVVFGAISHPLRISAGKYRFEGLAASLDLMEYGPAKHPDVVKSFQVGYLWDRLQVEDPALARIVSQQRHCAILRGHYPDSATLDDLRNAVGLLTYLVDSGCCAVYDPQMFRWWSADDWRTRVFDPQEPSPRAHVSLLFSDDGNGTEWYHTRGLRKFGRPDLSIHRVTDEHRGAVIDLCNRFIEFQALGGVIAEGEEVRMESLPAGMRCRHGGSLEDPDFNNTHLEILWPAAGPGAPEAA